MMQILVLLGMYFEAVLVFVTSQTLLFRLALAILCPYQIFRLSYGPNMSVVQLHVAIKQGVREMWSMTLKIALMLVVVVWLANLSLLLVTFLSRHTIDDTKKELLLSEETFSAFEKGLFSSFLY